MNDFWKYNNRLREFQEWVVILDVEQLESSGILDLLKNTYSEKVAEIFVQMISSDEYEFSDYHITYDANQGPESAEISSLEHPTEYVELFDGENFDRMHFYTNTAFGNILSKRYVDKTLEDIIITDSNVIFLGRNRKPISHVNQEESIDYELEY